MTKRILDLSTSPIKVLAWRDLRDEEAHTITIEKGFVIFCTDSGQLVKLKANNLGDGIKRIVSFFKDLKNALESPMIESYQIEELLRKHEINLEAL